MVKGVMTTNKTMSGGRIAGANCFVNKARAINNAKRADYDRNKQTDSVQKELRIREDAIASGRLSERDTALLEARQKREAKEAKAALFLAQAEMAALALEDCGGLEAEPGVAGDEVPGVVLSIRVDGPAVLLTILPQPTPPPEPLPAVRPQAPAAAYNAPPVKAAAKMARIVKAAPAARALQPPPADSIAALVRLPGKAARAAPVASSTPPPPPPPLQEPEPHGVASPQTGGGAPASAARVVTVTRIGKSKKYGYRGQASYDD